MAASRAPARSKRSPKADGEPQDCRAFSPIRSQKEQRDHARLQRPILMLCGNELDKSAVTLIGEIREKISTGRFELSKHAVDQSIVRRIGVQELREVVVRGEVIENYPDDKYGPSCLIFGTTSAGRPLHVQCSYPSRTPVRIITLYEPTPERWIDFKRRRPG